MKLVFRLLALSCLLWGGCGDQKSDSSPPAKPAPPPEASAPAPQPAQPQPQPAPPKQEEPPAPAEPKPPAEPQKSDLEKRLETMYPLPQFKPLEEIVSNWENVPQEVVDAVKAVKVNTEADYKLFANGAEIGTTKAPAGHQAKPLKFRPGQLLVTNSRDGNIKAVINLDDTDFKDQVRAMYDDEVEKGRQGLLQARKAAEQALKRQGGTPAGEMGSATSDPRFKPAVDYLASGKMINHTLEQARQWIWLGNEEHEGKTYDVILVQFEVETIFGLSPRPMKCLMENGRVVQWIPVS